MKLQRLFQLFILVTLFFTPIGSNGSVHASLNIDTEPFVTTTINPSSVNVGETALVSVSLNNIPQEGYSGAEFTCAYNLNSVEVSNIIVTQLFGANPITVVNGPQNGYFILAIAGHQGSKATTSGPVFTFHVKGVQPGQIGVQCSARIPTTDKKALMIVPSTMARLMVIGNPSSPAPATPTVIPPACKKMDFIADVTVPPGTVMFPGSAFRKTWRFMNVGNCPWTNSDRLVFYGGDLMASIMSVELPVTVEVGQTVDISLDMTAPLEPGSHHAYWMMRDKYGAFFGIGPQGNQAFLVNINVSSSTPTYTQPTNSPTATFAQPAYSSTPSTTPSGPTATPLPGVFFDFVANACSATWHSGAGPLPCPGTEGDTSGFMLKLDHPLLESEVIDTRPGLLMVPQNINNGYIQGIYPAYKVKPGDWFRATIGCEFESTNCYVVFRLDYAILGSNNIQTLWAFVEKHDGQLYNANIDLTPLVGQDVKFTLTILSTGSATDDRAIWVNPIIYRADPSATTPIRGQVFAGKPVTISLYREDNSLFTSVDVDSEGKFNLAAPVGTYTMVASASGYLRAQGPVWLTPDSGPRISTTISLFAGDINGNDVIDQFDALTIGMNYKNSVPGEADLNNDGIIDVLDLEMLALHYQYGSVYWQ